MTNQTPESVIAEALSSAGAPLMHSRVEEGVASALRAANMLREPGDAATSWHDKSSAETAAVMNHELATVMQEQRDSLQCTVDALGSKLANAQREQESALALLNAHRCGAKNESIMESLVDARAERDAATAAIERVRALETFSITDSYPAWTAVDHDDLLAALDGAPEPDWEERLAACDKHGTHCWSCTRHTERRRPAGEWHRLPVEGEGKP